jgi:hypothetical protein
MDDVTDAVFVQKQQYPVGWTGCCCRPFDAAVFRGFVRTVVFDSLPGFLGDAYLASNVIYE